MTTPERISLASAIIAAVSLTVNVLQATIIYRLNRRNVARDDLIESLRLLMEKLEYSRVFAVDPNNEIWKYGFESLREFAAICSSAHVAVQHTKFVNAPLRDAVSELHDHVKALRSLHDSYSTFAHNKRGAPANIQKDWRDWERAKACLQAARPIALKCQRSISEFLKTE